MESTFQTLYLFFFPLISIRTLWNSIEGISYFPFSYFHGGGGWLPTLFPSRAKYGGTHSPFHLPVPHSSPGQEEDLPDPTDQWLSEKTTLDHPAPREGMLLCAVCSCSLGHLRHILRSCFVSNKDDLLTSTWLTPAFLSQFWRQEGQKVFTDLLKCPLWLLLLSFLF